jgi:branched-chain amino acid transport system permease protein
MSTGTMPATGSRLGADGAARSLSLWQRGFVVPLAAVAVVIVLVGLVGNAYQLTLLTKVAIYAVVILGLNVLVGYTGQISFGHNAFFGIGGYLSALSTTDWHLPPLLGIALGIVVSALLAVIVGYPTLRLKGHYLAMATFAVGLGFYSFSVASPLFKGFIGIGGIPPLGVGSFQLANQRDAFWACGVVLLVAITATWRLRHRRYGRALRSVASDEATAMSIAVDVQRYKLSAFVVSAVFGSVAGSLYAHTSTYVSPESFSFTTILTFFMMLFIGGLGSVWGAVVGSAIVTIVPDLVPRSVQNWQPTLFAVLLIAILIARPVGLLAPLSQRSRATLFAIFGRRGRSSDA